MNYALRLPDHLMKEAKELAAQNNTSLNQFFSLAISEKIGELKTRRFFEERAKNGSVEKALSVLDQVADSDPIAGDELS